jgi:hypothetical protein
VVAWLGWFQIAPALGFPTIGPAAMLNRVFVPKSDPGVWVGWVLLVVGLVAVAALYSLAAAGGWFRPGPVSGLLFGLAAWANRRNGRDGDHRPHLSAGTHTTGSSGPTLPTTPDPMHFFAAFDRPIAAVRCALAMVEAMPPLGVQIRAGVHTGEVEVRGSDLGGLRSHRGEDRRARRPRRSAGLEHSEGPARRLRRRLRGSVGACAQRRARDVAVVRSDAWPDALTPTSYPSTCDSSHA